METIDHKFWNCESMEIIKSSWKNSIDIYIKHDRLSFKLTDILNIFLLLKAYLQSKKYHVKYIYIISYYSKVDVNYYDNKNLSYFVYNFVSLNLIQKFSFYDFYVWYDKKVKNVFEYSSTCENVGFKIVFYNDIDFLEYPTFPWKKEFLIYNDVDHIMHSIQKDE